MSVCSNLNDCLIQYFASGIFMFDQRMISFSYYFNAFICYLFIHDEYITFSISSLIKLLKNCIFILYIWTNNPLPFELEFDIGSDFFDLLITLFGTLNGILFVWITNSPRFFRFPKIEIEKLKKEYNLTRIGTNLNKFFGYELQTNGSPTMNDDTLKLSSLKYYIELFCIQYFPPLLFFLIPNNEYGNQNIIVNQKWFREDWFSYTGTQIILIVFLYHFNWLETNERYYIWNNNKQLYKNFHLFLLAIFIILMLPSIYMWMHPRFLLLFGIYANFLLLVVIGLFKFIYSKIKQFF